MLIILLFGLASCLSVEDEQKTQSPFFYLSKESHIENLPLKATRAVSTFLCSGRDAVY